MKRKGMGAGKGKGYKNLIKGYDKKVHSDSSKGRKQPQKMPFIPTPIKFKQYKCSKCGFIKEIDTNHYGECYSLGHFNACPNCPPYAKYPEFGGSTTWKCMEKPPKPENVPEKWKKYTLSNNWANDSYSNLLGDTIEIQMTQDRDGKNPFLYSAIFTNRSAIGTARGKKKIIAKGRNESLVKKKALEYMKTNS